MSGLLADVFSFGNTAKRKIKGLLDDPMGSITQYINNENDRAGRFNQLTAEAAQEGAQAIKQGKSMVGPKSQQLAGLLADAYNPAGMVVWHGSPHRFTKFDSSKIGTGEGAQAYGHGLYVAESKGVGEDYAKVLASPRNRVADKAGVYIDPSPMGDGKYRLATQSEVGQMRGQVGDATQGLTDYDFPNLASAIKAAKKQGYLPKDERPLLHAIGEDGKYVPVRKAIDTEELLGIDPQYSQFIASTPGNLYKIDLPDEHIAKMLDWDKPLSQQAGGIKQPVMTELQTIDSRIKEIVGQFPKGTKPTPEAIKEVNALNTRRSMLNLGDDATGADVYNSLVRTFGDQDAASGYLRQQGIPGIRYLDGGSRGTGQGTSNFVVFPGNEDLLKILEINGKPVGGLMNEVKGPQAEALETARKNAVKMLGLPENNTPMDRAKALGFDTEAFHSTGADFREFKVNPYRGAVSVAAHPSGAVHGAKAGAADGTGTGATSVMPLLMRSEGVQGLRLPQDQVSFLKTLPDVATESQVDELMKSAPKGSFWGNFFNEIQNPDGTFSYARKSESKVSFSDVQKTSKAADGSRIPNWGDERWSSNRQKQIGGKGWLQQDESGISASIVDPSILRSRFAAFDPARVNENDLLGGVTLPMLGLLSAGGLGAAYLTSDK